MRYLWLIFLGMMISTPGFAEVDRCTFRYDARTKVIEKKCVGRAYGKNLTKEETRALVSGAAQFCVIERVRDERRQRNRRECR
jgi:hypothetical protein